MGHPDCLRAGIVEERGLAVIILRRMAGYIIVTGDAVD